jgi:crotonobetainyl-CoA hydratase
MMAQDMETAPAVLTERIDHVLLITINRPEARNAINLAVHLGVGRALVQADADPQIRVIVLTGAGDKAFCAGADLKAVAAGEPLMPDDPVERGWGFAGYVNHPISKPTIAAVNGTALGGGTELVLASDLAIVAEGAQLGLPEVRRSLFAGAGGAFRITRQVPQKIAMEMLLVGEPFTAQRALELGLVNAVVPQGEVRTAALSMAHRIAANAPLAVQISKRMARGIMDGSFDGERADWARNEKEGALLMQSADMREGARAFAENREPVWTGR